MKILRDGMRFIVIGAIQILVDSATYIAMTKFGVGAAPANICGRCAGALLGFWLNGRVTFAHHEQPRLHLRLARYLTLWLLLTTVSTASLVTIANYAGLARSWWCKPLIEIVLGVTSFLLSRHWVYRR
jgi:putative flippase GtrA